MSTNGITKPYTAGATIAARRIVKFGAADGVVIQAAAATDLSIGVSTDLGSASGERQDVFMIGNIAEVDFGGTIARGTAVTADATGKAVAAIAGNKAVGFAEVSGVTGDVGTVIISPHTA
ncbi:MAG: DUF2190 family protein [Sphingomonas sp.]|nr:DUF2190 family protein [Sphingomonas sp.]